MKARIKFTGTAIVALLALSSVLRAQTAADSVEIYIKQSPVENSALPENRLEFNERPVLNQNAVRSISLYYAEQNEWVTFSSNENLLWASDSLAADPGIEIPGTTVPDSISGQATGNRGSDRLAELLGNVIGTRPDSSNGGQASSRINADEETMNAFRAAFEAVMREEDKSAEADDGETVVDLPAMAGRVNGIVLDETRSKTGRDFYNAFYEAWSMRDGVENSVVRVAEKPGPGLASIVFVEVNYEEIFELRLRPGDPRTKQAGDIAAERTLNFLKEQSNKPLTY